MDHQIALFTFTLADRGSIGPVALKALWARCCGSDNVGVARQPVRGQERHIYTLYAPQSMREIEALEGRLRVQLEVLQLVPTIHPAAEGRRA